MLKVTRVNFSFRSNRLAEMKIEWYNVADFENFPEIIENFYSCYPRKPKSRKRVI